MNTKTVLILGGGVGGIVAANALRDRLPEPHRVVVVEKQAEHVFSPSLLWVMVGWRRPQQVTKPLQRMLRPGVELLLAEVLAIEPESQRVKTSAGDQAYDYLVIALGAGLNPEAVPGFTEAAHTPYDLDGATGLWKSLQQFEGGRVAVLVAAMPYKCPAAPYETALLLDDYLRRKGLHARSQVDVYTPETLPMGVAGPGMGRAVVGMLEARGIGFHPQRNLSGIEAGDAALHFDGGELSHFDLLAGIPPHRAPVPVRETALSNQAGWVPVDRRTLQTNFENVYALGDVSAVTLSNGMALPKAGVFADGQAHVVANRIAQKILGPGPQDEFDGFGFCWIETGGGSAGFASGEFYAEPDPRVPLPRSGRLWHWGKIVFEKYWLGEGATRMAARLGLQLGSRMMGVPVSIRD